MNLIVTWLKFEHRNQLHSRLSRDIMVSYLKYVRNDPRSFLCDVNMPFYAAVVDPSSRFMITASGNRGWWGDSTRVVIIHSIVPHY